MNYQTELMRSILKSERAQQMIDYVSPVYGDSYVGLWLFEVMGQSWDKVWDIFTSLRNETTPITADKLIGMWEDSYGIPRNSSLTLEQRRARLIAWRDRGPCNPHRLAAAVSSALNGVPVDIQENIAKNTFLVNIREFVDDVTPVRQVLDRKKPAHLIYEIMIALEIDAETDVKVAVGASHSEQFCVQVAGIVIGEPPERPTVIANPIPNAEIDEIQEEVFASSEPMDGEIKYIEADLPKMLEYEVEEVYDEVF